MPTQAGAEPAVTSSSKPLRWFSIFVFQSGKEPDKRQRITAANMTAVSKSCPRSFRGTRTSRRDPIATVLFYIDLQNMSRFQAITIYSYGSVKCNIAPALRIEFERLTFEMRGADLTILFDRGPPSGHPVTWAKGRSHLHCSPK